MNPEQHTRLVEELRGILGPEAAELLAGQFPSFSWEDVVLRPESNNLSDDVAILRHEVQFLREDLEKVKTDVTAIKTDVTAIKTDVTAIKSRLGIVEQRLERLEVEVAAVRDDVTDLKVELAALRAELTSTNARIDIFRAEMHAEFAKVRQETSELFRGEILSQTRTIVIAFITVLFGAMALMFTMLRSFAP